MRSSTAPRSFRLALARSGGEAVRRHAAGSFPEECCGFLLGRSEEAGHVAVERVLPAENEAPAGRAARFLIAPEAVLRARRRARTLGLEVVGYYHSHPDGSATPSHHDLEHAWPATSYLIVPVPGGVPGEPRSWRLRDDRTGFDEEEIAPADRGPSHDR